MDSLDELIAATIVLFLLSVITEKITQMARMYPSQVRIAGVALSLFFYFLIIRALCFDPLFGTTTGIILIVINTCCMLLIITNTNKVANSELNINKLLSKNLSIFQNISPTKTDITSEEAKVSEISALSFLMGLIISFFFGVNLFSLIATGDIQSLNGESLFQGKGFYTINPKFFDVKLTAAIGYCFTALFLSFGSKFFHDLLDRLYEVKRVRQALGSKETFTLDNTDAVAKIVTTFESEYIKAAFLEAQSVFMSKATVSAISLKRDNDGYYFEMKLKSADPSIPLFYEYLLSNGQLRLIPIKMEVLGQHQVITELSTHLGSNIYDKQLPASYGTLGCIVTPVDSQDKRKYILTCCHNLVYPISKITNSDFNKATIDPRTAGIPAKLGSVKEAVWNNLMDIALVEIDDDTLNKISNVVPGSYLKGGPRGSRTLFSSDEGKVEVFMYGATTTIATGLITSVYSNIKFTYKGTKAEHKFSTLLSIENNGSGIAEGGDSGSVILDKENRVLGIVVAGYNKMTYAIPIDRILGSFEPKLEIYSI